MTHFQPPSLSAPALDQIEINVFGPGVGECILVHRGSGSWLVIDSCKGRGQPLPAALAYMDAIGVSVDGIDMIVATHWHDDHIRGLAIHPH